MDDEKLTTGQIIRALQDWLKDEMLWRNKAISLLKMVGEEGINQEALKAACKECAESGLEL